MQQQTEKYTSKIGHEECLEQVKLAATKSREASRQLQAYPSEVRTSILKRIAKNLLANEKQVLQQNVLDVEEAKGKISDSMLQRLQLKPGRIKSLASSIEQIAEAEDPIRKIISSTELATDLILQNTTCPIGVLMIIFEARPDAMPQISALSIKSGNGLLLKGGKEARRSNKILHTIITEALQPEVDQNLIYLVETRDEISDLLKLDKQIDLVIPRGSNELVTFIQNNTKIPVLGHADGICHVYVDEDADIEMAKKICVDSKLDYTAVCNACEKFLLHQSLLKYGKAQDIIQNLIDNGAVIYLDERAQKDLKEFNLKPLQNKRQEYGSPECGLEIVTNIDEAIDYIHTYGSSHTECIITDNAERANQFLKRVDSACVHHNCSTRFADGFRYGLGAEVGVSTGRIHARGPVGIKGLLTTKCLLRGTGQIVNKDKDIQYTHKELQTK